MFTRLGLLMNHYTVSFFLQTTKTLSLALPTSNSSRIESARHLVRSDFCKDLHKTLKYVDEFPE